MRIYDDDDDDDDDDDEDEDEDDDYVGDDDDDDDDDDDEGDDDDKDDDDGHDDHGSRIHLHIESAPTWQQKIRTPSTIRAPSKVSVAAFFLIFLFVLRYFSLPLNDHQGV